MKTEKSFNNLLIFCFVILKMKQKVKHLTNVRNSNKKKQK